MSEDRKSNGLESGQGLVEYALILVLVAIVVIVVIALTGNSFGVKGDLALELTREQVTDMISGEVLSYSATSSGRIFRIKVYTETNDRVVTSECSTSAIVGLFADKSNTVCKVSDPSRPVTVVKE